MAHSAHLRVVLGRTLPSCDRSVTTTSRGYICGHDCFWRSYHFYFLPSFATECTRDRYDLDDFRLTDNKRIIGAFWGPFIGGDHTQRSTVTAAIEVAVAGFE